MDLWYTMPLAIAALLAVPYTIWVRRKRREDRWREMGGSTPPEAFGDPALVERPESPEDRSLWARLIVSFVLCAGLAWLCYRVLPRFGVDTPWWVPVLVFLIILGAAVFRRAAGEEERGESENEGVVGRIGPDFMPRPDDER